VFGDEAIVLKAKQCIIRYGKDDQLDLGNLDPRKAKIETRIQQLDPRGRRTQVAYLVVPGKNNQGLDRLVNIIELEGDHRRRYLDAFMFLYKQGCPSTKLAF